tara:strand:+ start:223 stop:531 length:309 start_codon:yes stop_codon:yes gene_type:complete
MSFAVSTKHCWYDDASIIVKMYFLNDIPFTFDDLPDGHLYDKSLVEEANGNAQYEMEDIYRGSQYLILEQAHPCFDPVEILNPENLPEDIQTFYNGEEDLLG